MSANQKFSTDNVEDMMKDFVATRPRRPRSGRVVAGVAAGIGRRYAIDPVIVRVAFVVSAIYGGAGILAYLVGWLLLAAEGDEVSAVEALLGRGRSSMSRGLTVGLCIALIPAANFVFGGHYSTVAGLIVLSGGLYLLHRYRADLGQIDTGPAPTDAAPTDRVPTDRVPTDAVPADAAPTDAVPTDAVPTETLPRTEPPAWDPLGAAPFAWDLPEPGPVPPTPPPPPPVRVRRHRSRVGLATAGVIFVTAALLAVLAPAGGWLSAGHIVGILAAIAGIGLIAGAFSHSGRGLIWLAVLLAGAGYAMTSTHYDGWHGAGDFHYRPTSVAQVQPLYEQSFGDMNLDLTALPAAGTVNTQLKLTGGDVIVRVPEGAQVEATCTANVGDVDCLGQHRSGPSNRAVHTVQQGTSGNKLTIVLDVRDSLGDVEVTSNG